jgi:hypothetical protein
VIRCGGATGKVGTVQRQLAVLLVSASVAGASLAATAVAAVAVRGATYSGHLRGSQSAVSISFHTSADGRQVQSVRLGKLPIYCSGNGPPASKVVFGPARVSGAGTFTATGRDAIALGPLKGTPVARLTLSGTFAAGRRESGTFTVYYLGALAKCNGHSAYSTGA